MPPEELIRISDALGEGRSVNPVTVREFLSWFDARRRRVGVVAKIRSVLAELELTTVPDFEEPWLDGLIAFGRIASGEGNATGATAAHAVAIESDGAEPLKAETAWEHREAGYRLSRFQAANKLVIGIAPDASISEAVTKMMLNDFSQLPVMTSERDVKGVVTWSEIAMRSVLGHAGLRAADFMVEATVLEETASIFDAIQAIVLKDFVLVRDRHRRISGIVTAADLSLQFRGLSEPFLLLSEIETHVRNLIGQTFPIEELSAARDQGSTNEVNSVADLTFGEYVHLLQNEDNWNRLGIKIDRRAFCARLDSIRAIRNQVMHFDPDGLDSDDLQTLQEFSLFLKRLESINI